MLRKKSTVLLIIVCLVSLIVSLVVVSNRLRQPEPKKNMAIAVQEVVVKAVDYQPQIQTVGTLKAQQGVTLKAQVAGAVTEVAFQPGDKVKQGQLLVSLDSTTAKGQLDKAEADYHLSLLTYQRDQSLFKNHVLSEQELDQVKFTVKANRALLEQAQSAYNKTQVKAPFNGNIGISDITVGSYLDSGDAIVSLQNLDHLWVDFNVSSQDSLQVKIGETVDITTQTEPVQIASGKVIAIEPQINSDTGTLTLRAQINNTHYQLLPGQLVSVNLYTNQPEQRLQIPETAVQYNAKGAYVYIIGSHHQVIQASIVLGENRNGQVIVHSGLKAGEKVVLNNVNLHDGATVAVIQG
ncbi:efflux RND transporter periplasmic adaptor subunit [Piscirickettsia salmonis]|uniref:efflux RND transporter periplasmic adaptor subunit n=1 Tax=Piscirickettsia salmonis TaxID=1238 RepID=UPI0007C948CA|nr:Multidrug resistance protein MdtA precursor [Piscirickettsiaceae bacterium NZ-RLO1]